MILNYCISVTDKTVPILHKGLALAEEEPG